MTRSQHTGTQRFGLCVVLKIHLSTTMLAGDYTMKSCFPSRPASVTPDKSGNQRRGILGRDVWFREQASGIASEHRLIQAQSKRQRRSAVEHDHLRSVTAQNAPRGTPLKLIYSEDLLLGQIDWEGSMKVRRAMFLSFLMLLPIGAKSQEPESRAPKKRPTRTKVVLLGTGTPVPDPDRSGPATAIVVGDSAYLVDFGPGVVRRAEAAVLVRGVAALEPANLKVAFVTHLHSDHTAGYSDL